MGAFSFQVLIDPDSRVVQGRLHNYFNLLKAAFILGIMT